MTQDLNKNIGETPDEEIAYNYFNLPTKVVVDATHTVEYIYDAGGTKLQKKVTNGSGNVTTTLYAGGFLYENGVLQYFGHAEGYARRETSGSFSYIYQYKDHLGNVRLTYWKNTNTNALEIISTNNYYAFGMEHKGYGVVLSTNAAQKIKFNSKELQDELQVNWYDYQARNYDPALGRWFNIDPLAEKSRRWSPYTFSYNNPMRFVDPDGMQGEDWVMLSDNSVKWDASVTTNEQAVAKYGEGATAIGKEVEYFADNGRSVALHDNGAWNYTDQATIQLPELNIGAQTTSSTTKEGSAMGIAHTALDVAGLVPGFGEIADGINAVMYAAEGDYTNAAISMASMVPLIGMGATAGKFAKKAQNAIEAADIIRIENAATKIGKPIHVVGSRASGTAHALSDWDYVIEGVNSKNWDKIKNSLPGSKSTIDNVPSNIDLFKGPLNTSKPYLTINPRIQL